MKVSIEVKENKIFMDYEFGKGRMHSEHEFWPDDFIFLLSVIQRMDTRCSTDNQKLETIKRVVEGKQTWSDAIL